MSKNAQDRIGYKYRLVYMAKIDTQTEKYTWCQDIGNIKI